MCGDPDIDVERLRTHATFRGGLSKSHPTVLNLWSALQSFSVEERQLFLRFVWGRNRLPAADSDWSQAFVINTMTPASGSSSTMDDLLPAAHTCFFQLDLPAYSTAEVMRSKLLYAVHHCQAIDTDFTANETSGAAFL